MHGQGLAAFAGIAEDGGLDDVDDLLDDVQFGKGGRAARRRKRAQAWLVFQANILNMPKPVVAQAHSSFRERSLHAAATVMSADDDVFDLQHIHGELHDGQTVQIGVDDEIGDVAMDKQFAGQQPDDFIRGHAAVRTADP